MTAMTPVPSVLLDQLREAMREIDRVANAPTHPFYAQDWENTVDAELRAARAVLDAVQPTAEDDKRPCKGENSNVCVAEGCYGEACLAVPSPAVCPTEAEDDPYAGIREEIRADERQRFEHWRSGVLSVIDDMETATEYGTMPGVRRHVRREWATRLRASLSDPVPSVPTTQERIAQLEAEAKELGNKIADANSRADAAAESERQAWVTTEALRERVAELEAMEGEVTAAAVAGDVRERNE